MGLLIRVEMIQRIFSHLIVRFPWAKNCYRLIQKVRKTFLFDVLHTLNFSTLLSNSFHSTHVKRSMHEIEYCICNLTKHKLNKRFNCWIYDILLNLSWRVSNTYYLIKSLEWYYINAKYSIFLIIRWHSHSQTM